MAIIIGPGISVGRGISVNVGAGVSLPSGYVTLVGLTWAPMTTGGNYDQSQTYAANFTGLGFSAGTWRSDTVAELQRITTVRSYKDAINVSPNQKDSS
jgi:hypothetical protein